MGLVLDASATLAWLIKRVDAAENQRSIEILKSLPTRGTVVPALWFPEVANGILVAERRGGISQLTTATFLEMVNALPITADTMRPSAAQATVLSLARIYRLTSYDATYLELTLRTGAELATFDRQLVDAVRKAGGRVFGDPA